MSSSKTPELSGGQLGQMMAISAICHGAVIALDLTADCPASAEIIVAPYNDVDARWRALRCPDLQLENVDADGLDAVIKDGQLPTRNRSTFTSKPDF